MDIEASRIRATREAARRTVEKAIRKRFPAGAVREFWLAQLENMFQGRVPRRRRPE